jgi:hypothetical protein
MNIVKKIKCLHCGEVIEGNRSCGCGQIMIDEDTVLVGAAGKDYVDVSQKLLNE